MNMQPWAIQNLVQQITEQYPDAVITTLTEYLLDNDPRSCANRLYQLTLDDKNFIIIENVDYYKLYSLYNDFMRLKSQKVILPIHRFILSSMFLMRGSHFILILKTVPDDTIRETLRTVLAPQLPCSSCGDVLKVGTRRLKCNSCFVDYCRVCSGERCADKYWCKYCNHHMIYHKLVKPTGDLLLKRLNDVIARKIRHDISIGSELLHGGFGVDQANKPCIFFVHNRC